MSEPNLSGRPDASVPTGDGLAGNELAGAQPVGAQPVGAQPAPVGQADAPMPPIDPVSAEPERFAEQRAVLDGLAARPLIEHADAFGQVHAQLQAALAEIDGV